MADYCYIDDTLEKKEVVEALKKSMEHCLNERERKVLTMHYGLEGDKMTLKEIGKILGVGQSRVGQMEGHALRKLRHPGTGLVRCIRG